MCVCVCADGRDREPNWVGWVPGSSHAAAPPPEHLLRALCEYHPRSENNGCQRTPVNSRSTAVEESSQKCVSLTRVLIFFQGVQSCLLVLQQQQSAESFLFFFSLPADLTQSSLVYLFKPRPSALPTSSYPENSNLRHTTSVYWGQASPSSPYRYDYLRPRSLTNLLVLVSSGFWLESRAFVVLRWVSC